MKKIYCLYEFSGRFANLYKDLGYEVYPIDLRLGSDIFSFNYKEHEDVVGIISHPPCTHFSIAGTATWKKKTPEQMRQAKAQVQIVLDIVAYHKPIFWFIEIPSVGSINILILANRVSYFNLMSTQVGQTSVSVIRRPLSYGVSLTYL